MKTCTKCGKSKPISEFSKESRLKDGLSRQCRTCLNEYKRFNYHSGADREKRRAYAAEWRKRNKEAGKIYIRKYRILSPRAALGIALGRALKRRPSPLPVTMQELMDMYEADNGCCALSGVKMTWGNGSRHRAGLKRRPSLTSISIDRIDSSKGYERSNVRLICHGLNAFKGSHTDEEMLCLAVALISFQETELKRAA